MKKIITFDFDNTIAMSYMDADSETVRYVFQGYNQGIINLIHDYIAQGDEVFIVTSRTKSKEGLFPNDTVEAHLKRLELSDYFWPDRVYYTNTEIKAPLLKKLGSLLHYDDDVEEHVYMRNLGLKYETPLDFYEDSPVVAKGIIYDSEDRILLLQRGDEGTKWDLPGGHVKGIEADRGAQGFADGFEREVAEETGLILPFEKKIAEYIVNWKKIDYPIYLYASKLNQRKPEVDLTMQGLQENIDYVWVELENIDGQYLSNSTDTMKLAIEHLKSNVVFENTEPAQLAFKKKHSKMKKRLIGYGNNKHTGGGKGHTKTAYKRSKSAPPGFGAIGERKNSTDSKKINIKIKKLVGEKKKKKRYYDSELLHGDA